MIKDRDVHEAFIKGKIKRIDTVKEFKEHVTSDTLVSYSRYPNVYHHLILILDASISVAIDVRTGTYAGKSEVPGVLYLQVGSAKLIRKSLLSFFNELPYHVHLWE